MLNGDFFLFLFFLFGRVGVRDRVENFGVAHDRGHFSFEVHIAIVFDRLKVFHSFGVELENFDDNLLRNGIIKLDLYFACQYFLGEMFG